MEHDYRKIAFDLKDQTFTDRTADNRRYVAVCDMWGPDGPDAFPPDRVGVCTCLRAHGDGGRAGPFPGRSWGERFACGPQDFPGKSTRAANVLTAST